MPKKKLVNRAEYIYKRLDEESMKPSNIRKKPDTILNNLCRNDVKFRKSYMWDKSGEHKEGRYRPELCSYGDAWNMIRANQDDLKLKLRGKRK